MIITTAHQLYNTALRQYIGVQRNRLNGSDIDLLRTGGWDLVLYVPTAYDPATEKLGDLELTSATTCTRLASLLTQQEIDAALVTERESMNLSRLQFRKGVNALGAQKRADVESFVSGLTQDELDEWLYIETYERLSPLIAKIQTELGISDTQLDTFFRNSANL